MPRGLWPRAHPNCIPWSAAFLLLVVVLRCTEPMTGRISSAVPLWNKLDVQPPDLEIKIVAPPPILSTLSRRVGGGRWGGAEG
jgi:hypothetical protein